MPAAGDPSLALGDTIAAISTPPGEGGIAIVRVSGPRAIPISDGLFRGRRKLAVVETHTVHHGLIVGGHRSRPCDEVLVTVMRAPHTYTGEDVIEISCHGGRLSARSVLEMLVESGVRLAGPGEFTRRAFLNGRIDLAQAEAVVDIVKARTSRALHVAVQQLTGGLSRRVREIRDRVIELVVRLGATLDFPEDEVLEIPRQEIAECVEKAARELGILLERSRIGSALREGVSVAIVGKPNVGKSTLFNALLGEDRAIVATDAGTTRDLLEGWTEIDQVPVRLMDGAGIRAGVDSVEIEGVRRAHAALDEATAALLMIDASSPLTVEDGEVLKACRAKESIVVLNKCDLPRVIGKEGIENHFAFQGQPILEVSSLTGMGLEGLKGTAGRLLFDGLSQKTGDEGEGTAGEILMCNMRHIAAARGALSSLGRARAAIEESLPDDLLITDLVDAAELLGQVIGEDVSEEVLERIFSQFCIGK